MGQKLYPRSAEALLRRALNIAPVVLIHGPRQCGKTTLAKMVGESQDFQYYSFDDPFMLEHASTDPKDFMRTLPERCILDEVQRVPGLFSSLKMEIDRERAPGRFIMTGSSNVMLLPKLSDSLAGRMVNLRLHPLSQAELSQQSSSFLDCLFTKAFEAWRPSGQDPQIHQRILAGGYPSALECRDEEARFLWYRNHIDSIIQRDVQDLAQLRSLEIFSKLLALTAAQTAGLYNMNKLATQLEISQPTAQHHVILLEQMFLLERLYPWRDNHPRQLIKTPKMHFCDTGIACTLLGLDSTKLQTRRPQFGHLWETFVFQELRRQSDGSRRDTFNFFRNRAKVEVDVVIQRGPTEACGVEIKASSMIDKADLRGLKVLRGALGEHFVAGVVLYDGELVRRFDDQLFAVPVKMLWEAPASAQSDLPGF